MVTVMFDSGAGVVWNTAREQGSLMMIVNAIEAVLPSTVAVKVIANVPLSAKVALLIVTLPEFPSALVDCVTKLRFGERAKVVLDAQLGVMATEKFMSDG